VGHSKDRLVCKLSSILKFEAAQGERREGNPASKSANRGLLPWLIMRGRACRVTGVGLVNADAAGHLDRAIPRPIARACCFQANARVPGALRAFLLGAWRNRVGAHYHAQLVLDRSLRIGCCRLAVAEVKS